MTIDEYYLKTVSTNEQHKEQKWVVLLSKQGIKGKKVICLNYVLLSLSCVSQANVTNRSNRSTTIISWVNSIEYIIWSIRSS